MAALAVSFGLQFREAFDIAHLKKKKKSLYENHHPRVQSLSDLNVSWSCQHLLYFYGICDITCFPTILSDCDQWANVLHVWYGDDFRSVYLLDVVHFVYSVQVPLRILKIMLVMFSNMEKWSRLQISFCIVCLFDDCVQLYILCFLKNECLPF